MFVWISFRCDYKPSLLFIIIWQGSLEVNPRVLIGSFLVGILPYGPANFKKKGLLGGHGKARRNVIQTCCTFYFLQIFARPRAVALHTMSVVE